jgi:Zn-dependent peptidase ImmA (M78 family)
MIKKKFFIIHTAPYDTDVLILNGTNEKETETILKRYGIKDEWLIETIKEGHKGACIKFEDYKLLMWIRNDLKPIDKLSTIAHEIQHLVCMVYKITGMKLDPDNAEWHCHLTGYLTTEIYKNL